MDPETGTTVGESNSKSDEDGIERANSYDWFKLMKYIGNSLSFSSSTDSDINDEKQIEDGKIGAQGKTKSSWFNVGFSYPLYKNLPEQTEKETRNINTEKKDMNWCNRLDIISNKNNGLLCLYFITQIVLGNFFAQIGTTIIDLADQIGYDSAADLNYIYVMDFLGNVAGSIIGGVIIEYLYGVDVKMIIALGFLGLGITDVFIPMQKSFAYLALGVSICEAFYAIVEAGVQNSITRIYGLHSSTILNYGNIWFAIGVAWTPVVMNMFDSLLDKFLSIAVPAMILGPIWLLVDLYDERSETNIDTLKKTISSSNFLNLRMGDILPDSMSPSKISFHEEDDMEQMNEDEEKQALMNYLDTEDDQNEKIISKNRTNLHSVQQTKKIPKSTPISSPSRNNSPRDPLPGYDIKETDDKKEGELNNLPEIPAFEKFESKRGKLMVVVFLLLQFCVIGALSSFTNWSSFYQIQQGLSTDTGGAAYSISIIWLGVALGSIVSAYVQYHFQINSIERLLYPLICLPALAITPVIIFPLNKTLLYISYAIFGFFLGPVQGLLFKLSNSLLEPTGIVMAFHITGMMTGSSLVPWIEGYYVDSYPLALIYSAISLLAFAILVIFFFYEIHQVISPASLPKRAQHIASGKEI